jgi:hypothetical protein
MIGCSMSENLRGIRNVSRRNLYGKLYHNLINCYGAANVVAMSRSASLSTALDCPEATVVHVKPTGSILSCFSFCFSVLTVFCFFYR